MTTGRPNPTFVYQWFDFGFFSELNHMLLAILYCRRFNKHFVLSSRYGIVFPNRGWRDFFRPFCPETDSRVLHFLDSRPLGSSGSLKSRLRAVDQHARRLFFRHFVQALFYPGVEVLSQNWEALRALIPPGGATDEVVPARAGGPEYGHLRSSPGGCAARGAEHAVASENSGVLYHPSLREALKAINQEVWRFNDETAEAVRTSIVRLRLPPLYGALHIRRGDMGDHVEPIDEIRYIERLEHATPLRDVYLATDDYRCVERVQRLRPSWRVWSLCPKAMRGYFPQDFDNQPADERGRRTLLLLTETEILKGADVFVGTFSSGIGTYQGIARDRQTYGVDCEQWLFEGGV